MTTLDPQRTEAARMEALYQVEDPRFADLIQGNARLWRLATGFEWTEGPCWMPLMQRLVFSDIPGDRMLSLGLDGTLSELRKPAQYSNGHARDREGRLLSCLHGARAVVRTEHDGTITVLADSYDGKRLNSPNDVIAGRDGSVWFSDPTYGILSDFEGGAAVPEQEARRVYRISPEGDLTAVAEEFGQPNGLCFSPDEKILYVADSGASHDPDHPRVIRAYDVEGGALTNARDFAFIDNGIPDGMRVDHRGNLWSSAADGVHCFAPDGERIGKLLVPEVVANLTFGGPRGNRLFICGTTSIYVVGLNVAGAAI